MFSLKESSPIGVEKQAEQPSFEDQRAALANDVERSFWDRFKTFGKDAWKHFLAVFSFLRNPFKKHENNEGRKTDKGLLLKHKEELERLDSVLEKNPNWLAYAQTAGREFDVNPELIFAFCSVESSFNPKARPINKVTGEPLSSATGLGQFIDATWKEFQRANPKFKDKAPTDPEASFYAIAWYIDHLSNTLDIDKNAPDAFAKLYTAYHEGPKGYKRLEAFRENGETFSVPKSYRNRTVEGVEIGGEDDCQAYSDAIAAIAEKYSPVYAAYRSAG